MAQRNLPMETWRKARTTAGSKCELAQRASSSRASRALIAFLYERAAVIVS
jgi:hypothetical protein